MSKLKFKKKIHKTSFFWIYYILGTLAVLVAIFFSPLWQVFNEQIVFANWYKYCLGLLIALLILFYTFTILIKRMKAPGHNKVIKVLLGLEFALMILMATFSLLDSIFYTNENFNFFNTLDIIAIIIWTRGFVEIVNAYYYNQEKGVQKYPIWFLLLNIFLISLGPILLFVGIKFNETVDLVISYIFSFAMLFFGSFLIIWGFLTKPLKIVEEPIVENEKKALEENSQDLEITNNKTDL